MYTLINSSLKNTKVEHISIYKEEIFFCENIAKQNAEEIHPNHRHRANCNSTAVVLFHLSLSYNISVTCFNLVNHNP